MDSTASEQTLQCPICFEAAVDRVQYRRSTSHSWHNHDRCDGHGICRPCLGRHAELKIMDEGKWNVRCPGVECTYLLIDADITGALADSWLLEDVLARRSKLQIENGGSRLQEVLTLALSDASQAWVLQQCQACPHCLVLTSRADGCMHMGCRCGFEFCYRCGGSMDLCICDFDDDDFDKQPCLGLWLLHIQPERLGNACAGLWIQRILE